MEQFLRQLDLSDDAIKIYRKSLGKSPLTHFELYSLVPNLSLEDFKAVLDELINSNLIVEIVPQKPEILLHYIIIPPFSPILTYYSNFRKNLSNIQDAIKGLVINSLNQIFQNKETKLIDNEALYEQFQEIRKDFSEDSLIQKQDVEEIVEDLENLKQIKELLSSLKDVENNLYQRIKGITQTEFASLVKTLTKIKSEINDRLKALDLKKKKEKVINIVEEVFKEQLNQMLQDFSSNLSELIREEFEKFEDPLNKIIVEPISEIIDNIFKFQNEFKILYLNVINDFEIKINNIQQFIIKNKLNLENGLKNLQDVILENLNEIINDSIEEFSGLSKPIENIMKSFFEKMVSSDRMRIDNIWGIKSKIKIGGEIANVLSRSIDEIMLFIPKIEGFLNIEQFKNLVKNVKVKIVSSEHHTNSLVRKFKEIPNIEFRTFKNDNVIALKGDDNYIGINIIQTDSKDPLNNVIGIASNYGPFIKLLNPIFKSIWAAAEPDFDTPAIHNAKPTIPPTKSSVSIKTQPTIHKPTIPQKIPSISTVKQQIFTEIEQKIPVQDNKFTLPMQPTQKSSAEANITEPSIKPQKIGNYISKFYPKAGDQAGMKVNMAFNDLIQKFNVLIGEDFSRELQKVADIILEFKGFSIILHDIRRVINKYKNIDTPLGDNDKDDIFETIESWKQRLL